MYTLTAYKKYLWDNCRGETWPWATCVRIFERLYPEGTSDEFDPALFTHTCYIVLRDVPGIVN